MFIDQDHSHFLLKGLCLLRQNEYLCDVEIRVGDSCLLAHKAVLAAVSNYFKAMFTGRMEESITRTINLSGIDEKSVSLLVDFAYTGRISLTVHNVQSLLITANMLDVSKVVEACCDFLVKQLHPSNCLGFLEFAEIHSLEILKLNCLNYSLENFLKLMQFDEYLNSSANMIRTIVSNDNLNTTSEEDVFLFLECWVLQAPEERMEIFFNLLSGLRLLHLSPKFLKYLQTHKFVACEEGYPFQLRINQSISMKINPFRLLDADFVNASSLKRRSSDELIVIGGKGGLLQPLVSCSMYNVKKDAWKELTPLAAPRIDASATAINDKIYLTGGTNYSQDLPAGTPTASMLCYSYNTNSWATDQDMNMQRSCHVCIQHSGYLYAIGGYNGKSCLKSVECYNPKNKSWKTMNDMNYSRCSFAAVTLEDYIYVLGGHGTAHLCTVERYDTSTGKWELMPAMSTKRINFGAAQIHGYIFVVGGHDGQDYLRSMERFDPILSEWTVVSPMPSPCTGIGVTVLHDHIYVLGGHDGNRYLSTVRKYNPCVDKWIEVSEMMNNRCYMAVTNLWRPS